MNPFELIPAIDLLDGNCVRLSQGRYDAATVYAADPAEAAERFLKHAIRRLHVVDLDGAKSGAPKNQSAIRAIVAVAGAVPVQLGGGIRTLAVIEECLSIGVERVILGTIALTDPDLVRAAAKQFAGHIAVGLDARDGRVAVQGWLETSDVFAIDLAKRFEDVGVAALIYTDISRDGMLSGPNLEATAKLAQAVKIPVIASGGVGSEADIQKAAALHSQGIAGVIVGRALYTGAVDLERALKGIECC